MTARILGMYNAMALSFADGSDVSREVA